MFESGGTEGGGEEKNENRPFFLEQWPRSVSGHEYRRLPPPSFSTPRLIETPFERHGPPVYPQRRKEGRNGFSIGLLPSPSPLPLQTWTIYLWCLLPSLSGYAQVNFNFGVADPLIKLINSRRVTRSRYGHRVNSDVGPRKSTSITRFIVRAP